MLEPNSPMNMLPFTNAPRLPNIGLTVTSARSGTKSWKTALSSSVGLGIFTAVSFRRTRPARARLLVLVLVLIGAAVGAVRAANVVLSVVAGLGPLLSAGRSAHRSIRRRRRRTKEITDTRARMLDLCSMALVDLGPGDGARPDMSSELRKTLMAPANKGVAGVPSP